MPGIYTFATLAEALRAGYHVVIYVDRVGQYRIDVFAEDDEDFARMSYELRKYDSTQVEFRDYRKAA